MENRSLEFILNQNKEIISELDDSTRNISSLEETIYVANQFVTEEVKGGKTFFLKIKREGQKINQM